MSIQGKTSLILVGSGTSLLDKENGKIIDSFVDVVRFNGFVTQGFEKYVGTKTTVWFNVNPTDRIGSSSYKKIYAHSWEVREEKCPIYNYYKDRENVVKLPRKTIDEVIKLTGGVSPSTGLLAIVHLLKEYEQVTITGYDWWENEHQHYYGKEHYRGPNHKPLIEKEIIDNLVKLGRVLEL